MIIREKPLLIVIAFPCTNWCLFTRLNYANKPEILAKKRAIDNKMLRLMVWTMQYQHSQGRLFLFENPASSAIWRNALMKHIYDLRGVCTATSDACAFGLIDQYGVPIWKTHRWLCNDTNMLHAVCKECPGHVHHSRVMGSTTKMSGVYTDALADSILRTLSMRKKQIINYH